MTIPQDEMYSRAVVEQLLEANKTLQEEVQRLTDSAQDSAACQQCTA